jgi:hypothetical protein
MIRALLVAVAARLVAHERGPTRADGCAGKGPRNPQSAVHPTAELKMTERLGGFLNEFWPGRRVS